MVSPLTITLQSSLNQVEFMSKDMVFQLTTERLKKMNIELGSEIGESIASMFIHEGKIALGISSFT